MASVSELAETVALYAAEPSALVNQIARELLNENLLPKSSGKRIAQVDASHAALLLFAVLASPRIKDAAAAARTYAALRLVPSPDAEESESPPADALAAVTSIITDFGGGHESSSFGCVALHVCLSWPEVLVLSSDHPDPDKRKIAWRYSKQPHQREWRAEMFPRKYVSIPTMCLAWIAHTIFGVFDNELSDSGPEQ